LSDKTYTKKKFGKIIITPHAKSSITYWEKISFLVDADFHHIANSKEFELEEFLPRSVFQSWVIVDWQDQPILLGLFRCHERLFLLFLTEAKQEVHKSEDPRRSGSSAWVLYSSCRQYTGWYFPGIGNRLGRQKLGLDPIQMWLLQHFPLGLGGYDAITVCHQAM
jgi:hypothetical protein